MFLRFFLLFCCITSAALAKEQLPIPSKHIQRYERIVASRSHKKLITSSSTLHIDGVKNPYNPSIIEYSDGYLLAFRHDITCGADRGIPKVQIGFVELDQAFVPKPSTVWFLNTGHINAEDPRLFTLGGRYYVSYTKVLSIDMNFSTKGSIAITEFDPFLKTALSNSDVPFRIGNVEKNWTPFLTYDQLEQRQNIYFIYKYHPYRVLKSNLPENAIVDSSKEKKNAPLGIKHWQKYWGEMRGGTPAVLVEDELLSFFHSSFTVHGLRYYVMGAVTFEKNPPFNLKRISKYPIFCKEMYAAPTPEGTWPKNNYRYFQKVIFPSGCVRQVTPKGASLVVAAGENDIAIRLLTFDERALMESLVDVNTCK